MWRGEALPPSYDYFSAGMRGGGDEGLDEVVGPALDSEEAEGETARRALVGGVDVGCAVCGVRWGGVGWGVVDVGWGGVGIRGVGCVPVLHCGCWSWLKQPLRSAALNLPRWHHAATTSTTTPPQFLHAAAGRGPRRCGHGECRAALGPVCGGGAARRGHPQRGVKRTGPHTGGGGAEGNGGGGGGAWGWSWGWSGGGWWGTG